VDLTELKHARNVAVATVPILPIQDIYLIEEEL
jgi:hypothetical protein